MELLLDRPSDEKQSALANLSIYAADTLTVYANQKCY